MGCSKSKGATGASDPLASQGSGHDSGDASVPAPVAPPAGSGAADASGASAASGQGQGPTEAPVAPELDSWRILSVGKLMQMNLVPSSIVHLTGFSEKAACVDQACQQALGRMQDFSVVTWGGDHFNPAGFTALIPLFLAGGAGRRVIAFRIKAENQHADFKTSWNALAEKHLGAFHIVELAPSVDFDRFSVRKDTQPGGLAADLGRGTQFFLLGRSAAKIPQTKRVIALGGGAIVSREMLCSLQDEVCWTVFALSRGKKEDGDSLMDLSAEKTEVELVRGIDPNEGLAFCRELPSSRDSLPSWVKGDASATRPQPGRILTDEEPSAQVVVQPTPQTTESATMLQRSLASSQFKRIYAGQAAVAFQDELFGALRGILRGYATLVGDTQEHADELFVVLQRQAFDCPDWESLIYCDHKEVAKFAVATWTSASIDGLRKQFCTILNHVLRLDSCDALGPAVVFCRAMTSHLVTRSRGQQNGSSYWPKDLVSHRGTNIPRAELAFFEKDKVYRAPMFLATSFYESKAYEFLHQTPQDDQIPVHFKFVLDPVRKCDHAMYIEGLTRQQEEHELLYAPYSAFKVLSINVPEGNITWNRPVVIEIEVQPNNQSVSEDVPLSQWH